MDVLPAELILHIATFLEARDIVRLHAASKRLFKITRDTELWRNRCFEDSYSETARRRRGVQAGIPFAAPDPNILEIQRRVVELATTRNGQHGADAESDGESSKPGSTSNPNMERVRAMANWDPSYPGERVDWYGEYIARHAPLSMSWLQQPRVEGSTMGRTREMKGMGLHYDKNNGNRVVAPLDDGSVCVWNLGDEPGSDKSKNCRRGAIIARSKAGLLSINGGKGNVGQDPSVSKAKMTSTGVVECVSVDSLRNKAYFAVQSGLNEIDLNTLQVSHHERYPFSISALSEATYPTPLTVGTTLSLHLHDPRRSSNSYWSENSCEDRMDTVANFPAAPHIRDDFYRLLLGDIPPEYASLFQPGPLAIHHVPAKGAGEIYVAGRFPSLLVYDRRYFPKLQKTIHSGARLCSLASLPYLWEGRERRLIRQSRTSFQDEQEPKSLPGNTLVACGEYNGKGSLELYGLPPEGVSPPAQPNQDLTYKNRVSVSRTKLLSVASHGTRLVVSDGDGQIRWIERDGSSLVRRWNINQVVEREEVSGIFHVEAGPGDVARKLLSTNYNLDGGHLDRDELLVWTGDRIGVLAFKNRPQFEEEDWEERFSAEEKAKRKEERIYGETMRRALERQADEVRFVRGLGLGP
ncbi:hypothetical protein MMC30_003148 [Trapelia coarctata]|nr:hypothetical protein [Trapelia coarctata]